MKACEYKWLRKIHGRKVGQLETINPEVEPRVVAWFNAGLIEKVEAPKSDGKKRKRKEND